MKTENNNMNNNCEQIQLLIEDYLDGMISSEDKLRMEKHISSCNDCKAYLEYTVMLIDNTLLMAKNDKVTIEKRKELWNKIESRITSTVSTGDTHVYNMSGLEDEYIPGPTPNSKTHLPFGEDGRGFSAAKARTLYRSYDCNRFNDWVRNIQKIRSNGSRAWSSRNCSHYLAGGGTCKSDRSVN